MIGILAKRVFSHFSHYSIKITRNSRCKTAIRKTNPDYDIVIKRFHLHYDMKLVTSGIDRDENLVIQFPVFIKPYTQKPLILYQIETVPVLTVDQDSQVDSCTHLQIDRPCIALNSVTYTTIRQ